MKDISTYLNTDFSADCLQISLAGKISFDNVEPLRREIDKALKKSKSAVVKLDTSKIDSLDSAGAALIHWLKSRCAKKNLTIAEFSANEHVENILKLFNFDRLPPETPPARKSYSFLVEAGNFLLEFSRDTKELTVFIGKFIITFFWSMTHPFKVKWGEVFYLCQRAGVDALPIVGLLSLLIGLVTAFSSAVQLRQFGANIFIADLVGIGMTREMGPLITAILLTGRSGSAFAAEIGTMQISDEIDALKVMGVKPFRYLILPRVLAVMMVMPFLTLFSDIFGILGGLFISVVSLDLTPMAFMNELQGALGLWDVGSGLLKSFVFGILVAAVGCFRGIETYGGALSVGKSTTSSVVSGIFLIVAADSVFAIVLHYLGLA